MDMMTFSINSVNDTELSSTFWNFGKFGLCKIDDLLTDKQG